MVLFLCFKLLCFFYMKRILIFSTAYLPLVGGAEIAVKEITSRIDDIEFDLITAKLKSGLPAKEKIGNVVVYRVGVGVWLDKFLLPVFGLSLAFKLYKTQRYSLAWAMMASQASVAAVFFSYLKKVKLLTTLQEGDEEEHLKRYVSGSSLLYSLLIKPWHTLAIKKADHIQVISEYLAKRAKLSGAKCFIEVIPNGVDVDLFTQSIPSKIQFELKNKLNIANARVIISVSRLVHKNGLDTLIKALKYIDNVKLILIGTGNQENKLKALDVENKAIFLGNIQNNKIPSYLNIADVFARPSRSEGQGISFLEAMAASVPVVATPVGGIVDFIEHEKTGMLAQVDSSEDVAQNIQKLLDNEDLRKKIIENSLNLIKEKYDWDHIAQKMNKLFIKL